MADKRREHRERTSDYYVVYDRDSGEPLGRVLNFTSEGMKLMGDSPLPVPATIACRMALPEPIDGFTEVFFEAETRWTQRNDSCHWYETGCMIFPLSDDDHRLIETVLRRLKGANMKVRIGFPPR